MVLNKYVFPLIIVSLVFSGAIFGRESQISLQPKWISEPVFKVPESVCFDSQRGVLYVSNINGASDAKDGNGFISQLGLDGKVINLQWITGLNAPKGMGIFNGKLYVTDIDQVVEIDISQGKIMARYPADGAEFLNDITISPEGKVFVSDMRSDQIYLLHQGQITTWLTGAELTRPNGLLFQENNLLIGCGKVLKVNPVTKKTTLFISDTGSIDGLVAAGKQNYLISDWSGHIHLIEPGRPKILLLDLTLKNMNAADIEYISAKKLLLIPTFSDNRVAAYTLTGK